MAETYTNEELTELAWERYHSGLDIEHIENEFLVKCGNDTDKMREVLRPVKFEYYKKNRKIGTQYLGIGFSLILIGFVVTCFNFHSNQSFTWAMYGLTTIGLGVVFYGLYKIIG